MAGLRRGAAVFFLLLGAGLAEAQTLRVVPIPPHIRPQWHQLPDNPKIFHAPNIPADVFKGAGGAGYYLKLGDLWYHSRTMNGPWTMMSEVPEHLYRIGPEYFKTSQAKGTGRPPIASPPPTTPQPPAGTPPGPKVTAKAEPTPAQPSEPPAAAGDPLPATAPGPPHPLPWPPRRNPSS